ncbi:YceI family protein [Endozoicomonas sp. SM1973]|uniref:YceI family protein n=1 Tax=Spartinivicinus marinus TaxID=2994442 RepID=A0A853IIG0_9GAMM|nr:YceI family protein [Spartinivicinus marinus]MCX4024919.1 YceI family protein [Spartinivicinus marinus]NYZ69187.1 YceI family protein [Spartinivicinus marinus]
MKLRHLLLPLVLASSAATATADWKLSYELSRLNFVSVKKEHVAESHFFTDVQGGVDAVGQVNVVVKLDSVETNIDIRNERMRQYLFETSKHPNAVITGKININKAVKLDVGASCKETVKLNLNLHGQTHPLEVDLSVSKLQDNTLLVSSLKPILIDASKYGMTPGIDKLKELAGLNSISFAVPVTFKLVFEKA